MNFGLPESTISTLLSVFKKYAQVEEVVIYGSRAKRNYRVGSDIDIVLKGSNVTEAIRSQIALDIDDSATPYLLDIAVFEHLSSPSLVEHINRVGKLFYKK